jgi:hypothetical protein
MVASQLLAGGERGRGGGAPAAGPAPPAPTAPLKAFRQLLFASSEEVAGALAWPGAGGEGGAARERLAGALRALPAAHTLHALVCRLPRACPTVAAKAKLLPRAYADLLDAVGAAGPGAGEKALAAARAEPAALARAKLFPSRAATAAQNAFVAERVAACVEEFRRVVGAAGKAEGSSNAAGGGETAEEPLEAPLLAWYVQRVGE